MLVELLSLEGNVNCFTRVSPTWKEKRKLRDFWKSSILFKWGTYGRSFERSYSPREEEAIFLAAVVSLLEGINVALPVD